MGAGHQDGVGVINARVGIDYNSDHGFLDFFDGDISILLHFRYAV
jgi:hypothetical protein